MSVVVRAIAPSDRADWERLFGEYGVFYKTAFTPEILERVWTHLGTEGSGLDALVAELDGSLVGIAMYRSHPDSFTGYIDWYLDDLYTSPEARGHGVATALIEEITRMARATAPLGTLRWITADDNERAQRVYDRLATKTNYLTYEVRL